MVRLNGSRGPAAALCLAVLAACAPAGEGEDEIVENDVRPRRIVSLDYCADQYVLKLADRRDVLALSPDATATFSYMRETAAGLATVRPRAEDVLLLKPDLVVRSYGGGPKAAAFFERAGVPVLQVGWASNIDGEGIGTIPALITHMAEGLGAPERGRALVADYRARLAGVEAAVAKTSIDARDAALYMTPGGVTSGPGSLVHEMMAAAGLANFEAQPGWRPLPLERLAYDAPDRVVAAFFDSHGYDANLWSATRHPVAKAQMRDRPVTPLKGAWTACGGWFILDAVEALARDAGYGIETPKPAGAPLADAGGDAGLQ